MRRPLLVAVTLCLLGCTSQTKYGECIGVTTPEQPNLDYGYSGWNLAMGVIFSETIVIPLVVVFDDVKCPVGQKPKVAP